MKIWYQQNAFKPPPPPHTHTLPGGLGCCPFLGGGSVVVDFFVLLLPLWDSGFCNCSMFCCAFLCVHSSFAIILMAKRELVALLSLSSWCLVIVVWLYLEVPRICLQSVIVAFPHHTHLLFFLFLVASVSTGFGSDTFRFV